VNAVSPCCGLNTMAFLIRSLLSETRYWFEYSGSATITFVSPVSGTTVRSAAGPNDGS
jgi:hypothetical protein